MSTAARCDRHCLDRAWVAPFALLALVLGLVYLLGDTGRTMSPSFATARYVGSVVNPGAPMHVWGLVFLSGFVCIGGSLIRWRRRLLSLSLFLGGTLYVWWAAAFLISGFLDPRASLSVWATYAMIAFVHYAASYLIFTGGLGGPR